jgi:uncharacterized UBP type Zn finger protein
MCFCYNKSHNHTLLHFQKFHHPIYLNIKGETEKKFLVICILCKTEIPYNNNPELSNLVNTILNKSNNSIEENDLTNCIHINNIKQEKSENLVLDDNIENKNLCLICGSCIENKNEHFNQTKHPFFYSLNLLGSDKNIVYCYLCNKEINDIFLENHLNYFGIKKNEKIQNTKDKELTNEKEKNLIIFEGKTGIKNNSTSSLNSIIQILFHLDHFNLRYYNPEHINNCLLNPNQCISCVMNKIMNGLFSNNYKEGININSFKNFFGKKNKIFLSNKEEDPFLILENFLNEIKNNDKYINPYESFEFQIEIRYECAICNHVKYEIEKKWYLTFNLNKNTDCSIEDFFKNFIKPEMIESNCSNCFSNTFLTKTKKILNYPKIFILILNRFSNDNEIINSNFKTPIDYLDIQDLNQNHSKENEQIILENDQLEEKEIDFDHDNLLFLIQCGIPEIGAKWALYKNHNNPEIAIEWYCENSSNDDYKKPLPKIKVKKSLNNTKLLYEKETKDLMEMGFPKGKVITALKDKKGNIDDALQYLISSLDSIKEDNFSFENKEKNYNYEFSNIKYVIDENDLLNKNNGYIYDLCSCLYVVGENKTNCHFECYIRDEEGLWGYYKDSNVYKMEKIPIEKGFIYFYKNKSK